MRIYYRCKYRRLTYFNGVAFHGFIFRRRCWLKGSGGAIVLILRWSRRQPQHSKGRRSKSASAKVATDVTSEDISVLKGSTQSIGAHDREQDSEPISNRREVPFQGMGRRWHLSMGRSRQLAQKE